MRNRTLKNKTKPRTQVLSVVDCRIEIVFKLKPMGQSEEVDALKLMPVTSYEGIQRAWVKCSTKTTS